MSEPKRWSEGSLEDLQEQRAAEMFRAAADVEPWDDLSQARLRRQVAARLARPPSATPRRAAIAVGLAAACGLVLAVCFYRLGHDGIASHLTISPGTQVNVVPATRPGDVDGLNLMHGLVSIQGADPSRALRVRTPQLTGLVHAASFFVEAAGERTTLFITEGEAWVGEVARIHLMSGQSIGSDDARLLPPSPTAQPPLEQGSRLARGSETENRCAALGSLDARFSCYLQVSMGNDQVAQNALFELGVIESEEQHDGPSAIVSWRAYLKRFPQGSLAPEAAYSILSEYLDEHRAPEVLEAASAFLARFPDDPRDDEVRLAAASAGCGVSSQASKALALLAPVLSHAPRSARGEALFIEAGCDDRLGQAAEARAARQTYLSELPEGPHATDARARLSSN